MSRSKVWMVGLALVVLFGLLSACRDSETDQNNDPVDGDAVACFTDNDCNTAAGETCVDYFCKAPAVVAVACTSNMDCPPLQYCNTNTGYCEEFASDGDSDGDSSGNQNTVCPDDQTCSMHSDCPAKGFDGYVCSYGCCKLPTTDGDGETDGDLVIEDCLIAECDDHYECNTDNGHCEPDDTHCLTTGCDAGSACDEEKGTCELIEDHCLNTGCGERFQCNEQTGICDPDAEHCSNTGCQDRYSCVETTGLCGPGSDHCLNDPCSAFFECNELSGLCEPSSDNCSETGCPDRFDCNDQTGVCDPSAEHCLNTLCDDRYACEEQSGLCIPDIDHCSNAGCAPRFDCNTVSGLCEPASNHCATLGCPVRFECNQETGLCDPDSTHCQNTGCDDLYACDSQSGLCEPGSGHCLVDGCDTGFDCNNSTGRCWPGSSLCSGSCTYPDSQFCINSTDFLCACNDNDQAEIVDCAEYCEEEGYPYLDECGWYTDSNDSSNNRFKCKCDNYDTYSGTCSDPIVIDSFPFYHVWLMFGAGNSLSTTGCQQMGPVTPQDGAYERVYQVTAEAGDTFKIEVNTDFGVMFDPYLTVRDQCGNNFTFCQAAAGTVLFTGDEELTITAPNAGNYYFAVEMTSALGDYSILVTKY